MPDGRDLAFTEWGVPDGRPVMCFHGTPGCRLWNPDEAATTAAGVRLIIPDRPGIGRSDPNEGWTLADWPKDVDALADALDIPTLAIVGVSAGGTPAAACAALIPGRLSGVAFVVSSSLASYNWAERPGIENDWTPEDREEFEIAKTDPAAAASLAARHFAEAEGPIEGLAASIRKDLEAAEGDRWFYEDSARVAVFDAHVIEWARQGYEAIGWEFIKVYQPWGFRLADITLPVTIYHGAQDPWVRREQIDWQAKTIPNSSVVVWTDGGHLGFVKHWREVLDAVA